jgi:lipoprotein-anchoring transpeptidase ErfK/SrfK
VHVLPLLLLACVACTPLLPATAQAADAPALRPAGATGPLGNELLSNERTLTRYAKARFETPIYRSASPSGQQVARLRFSTEDGYPEVYLALRSMVDAQQRTWIQIRVPGRPNGRTGWVLQQRLGGMRVVTTFLHVRRGRPARLSRNGALVWSAPAGTGARRTPTPSGHYWIREKFRASGGLYGPYAFGTADYSVLSEWPRGGVIGIHGTDEPNLIPGRPSHGCIRLRNSDVTRLYRLMPVGTPLLIT